MEHEMETGIMQRLRRKSCTTLSTLHPRDLQYDSAGFFLITVCVAWFKEVTGETNEDLSDIYVPFKTILREGHWLLELPYAAT